MPLYFFDLYDGGSLLRDEFGIDLASIADAADQAAALLPDVARDALPGGRSHNFAALVRDETEAVVFRAALLFRGQRSGEIDAWTDRCPSETDDLIMRSRATRAAARQISARLRADVGDFLAVVQDTMRAATELTAEASRTR